MIDYTLHPCKKCPRYPDTCQYPCQKYTDFYSDSENKSEDIHIINLKVDHLTDEKKQEIMRAIKQYSGEVCLDSFDDNVVINTTYEDSNDSETDIQNFLEYDVQDPLWLSVCNNKISYKELLDQTALLSYFQECNEKFCEENGLCKYCRNPLVEVDEDREHFGFDCKEKILVCSYGCE